ncbi:MAG: hypothetical protein QF363_02085 [Planctomycetaceae bacterium]|jgi:hypothetical protein|nr:hypothetical protein [Planctomycetaceae bacterium]
MIDQPDQSEFSDSSHEMLPAESPAETDNEMAPAEAGIDAPPVAETASAVGRLPVIPIAVAVIAVIVGIYLSWGSGDEAQEPGEPAAQQQQSDAEAMAMANPFLSTGPPRSTLEGSWVMIISQPDDARKRFDELCSGLFTIKARSGNLDDMSIRLVFKTQVFPDAELDALATSGTRDTAKIVFEQDHQRVDFHGVLRDDGIVYGNVVRGDLCLASRLVPTDQVVLDKNIAVMSTLDRPKLDAVMNKGKKQKLSLYERYRMFCREHPDTSLALDISLKNLMLNNAGSKKMSLPDFRKAVDEHLELALRWGPRMKSINTLILAHLAMNSGYPPEVSLAMTAKLAAEFSDKSWGGPLLRALSDLEGLCQRMQARIQADEATLQLASKDSGGHAKSLTKLRELRKDFPFSHFITYPLAEQAEKAKRLDEAIALFGEIVALPLIERLLEYEWDQKGQKRVLPSDTLARLWKQKHGDTKGLPVFLDQVFGEAVTALAKSTTVEAPKASGRQVLCELFTTVRVDAVIAGELSTAALRQRFGDDRVIVVRYHPLNPTRNSEGGDPLANDASLTRLAFYRSQVAPSLLIDGTRLNQVDGVLVDASRVYRSVVEKAVARMAVPSDWTVTLSARRTGESIKVTARAKGKTPATENQRLRLLLVEERVLTPKAVNGIRRQDMVVRWQIDDGDGVEPADGGFALDQSVSLAEVRKQLTAELVRFERLQGMNFPDKPMEMKSLYVIGFIQDKSTHEVLQSSMVKVTPAN